MNSANPLYRSDLDSVLAGLPDTEALWIFNDRTTAYTDGMAAYLKSAGATNRP